MRTRVVTALLCLAIIPWLVLGEQHDQDGTKVRCKILNAHVVKMVRPTYPESAREARVQGRVYLECIVARDGSVKGIEVKQGHPLLTKAAADAVAQWKFRPLLLNGEAVEQDVTVNIEFRLPKHQQGANSR